MTAPDLSHLRRLAEAATAHPESLVANAKLIVAMHNALPGMLDEIEAARRVVEAARGVSDPGLDRLRSPLIAYDRAIGAGGEG